MQISQAKDSASVASLLIKVTLNRSQCTKIISVVTNSTGTMLYQSV